MKRTHIKWIPIFLRVIFFAYQYFSSEKFVNPETGRRATFGLSTEQAGSLGLQSYRQVFAQAQAIVPAGFEWSAAVSTRLAKATAQLGADSIGRVH